MEIGETLKILGFQRENGSIKFSTGKGLIDVPIASLYGTSILGEYPDLMLSKKALIHYCILM